MVNLIARAGIAEQTRVAPTQKCLDLKHRTPRYLRMKTHRLWTPKITAGLIVLGAVLVAPAAYASRSAGGVDAATPTKSKQDRTLRREALFDALKNAETEPAARAIANEIWKFWMVAPTPVAQGLLDEALAKRRVYDFAGALTVIDKLIAKQPDYAEAWNQKATLLFFQRKLDESLEAIDETLQREPKHFGALAGQARIFLMQGRVALTRSALKRATEIFPFIPERNLLQPAQPRSVPETEADKT